MSFWAHFLSALVIEKLQHFFVGCDRVNWGGKQCMQGGSYEGAVLFWGDLVLVEKF